MGGVCSCENMEIDHYYIQNLRVLKNRSVQVQLPEEMNLGIVEIGTESKMLMNLILVQSFCIKVYENKSKQQFYDNILFNSIKEDSSIWGPQGKERFIQKYTETSLKDRDEFLIKTAFDNSQFFEAINKISIDIHFPQSYPEYIMPFSRMYNGILFQHIKNQNKEYRKQFYIVTCLTKNEESQINNLLKKSIKQKENLICFSKFMRAYSKENKKNARKKYEELRKKGKSPYFFTVNISNKYSLHSLNSNEDRGFYVYKEPTEKIKEQGDILLNIMNTYRLQMSEDQKQLDLIYGYGAFLVEDNKSNRSYSYNPQISHLLKFLDMASIIAKYSLKSQTFLLTQTENLDLSEEISEQYLTETKYEENEQLSLIQLQNLINICIIRKDYVKGLEYCDRKRGLMTTAKRLQILFHTKDYEILRKELKALRLDTKLDENIEWKEKIYLVHAKMNIIDKKFNDASVKLETVIKSMARYNDNDKGNYMSKDAVKFLAIAKRERDHSNQWDDFLRNSGLAWSRIHEELE